jgi:hypothetical protein
MDFGRDAHGGSLRLSFQFAGREIKLIDVRQSNARPMPQQEVSRERPTDFWYELHDQDDRSVFQRPASNPLLDGIEYVTGDSEQPLMREIPDDHRGRFLLTVPAIDATSVVLYGIVPGESEDEPMQLGAFNISQAIAGA